jgi:hypothetical protein
VRRELPQLSFSRWKQRATTFESGASVLADVSAMRISLIVNTASELKLKVNSTTNIHNINHEFIH